jgi:acyl-CoA thioester hydrolase
MTATSHPRQLVHVTHQAIRWADMDAFGHVNNTVYFRYMEQARIEWLYEIAKRAGHDDRMSPVIVNASCNFRVPLVYPGEVEIRMYLGAPGRTSIDSYYELTKDGQRYADGAARIVWVDRASGRPVPLPDVLALTPRVDA